MCGECKYLLKRRRGDLWERGVAGARISQRHLLGGNGVQKSPLITTYDICEMRRFIWARCERHYLQKKYTLLDPFFFLFLLSATEQIALSLVITSYFSLYTSQMVKCQIISFWQPTQAFINLFIPSVSSTEYPLLALYFLHTALAHSPHNHVQPHAPIQPLLFPRLTEDPFGQSVASTSMAGNDNEATVDWLRRAAGLESILGGLLCDIIWQHWTNTRQKKNVDV